MPIPTTTETVAANVRAELARSRRTQTDLAAALGIAQSAVSRRLRGETPFDVNELTMVARLVGVSEAALLAPALSESGSAA